MSRSNAKAVGERGEVVDVTSWTRDYNDSRYPLWWGILFLILVEATVVLAFLVSYFYLYSGMRQDAQQWQFFQNLPWKIPSVNTALVFVSALSMYYGGVLMDRDRIKGFLWTIAICCISATIALYLRWLHLQLLPFDWSHHAYSSFLWLWSGFHFFHLASGLLGTLVIGLFAWRGYYHSGRQIGVRVDTYYWYYIFLSWVPMYLALYIVPRLERIF